MSNIKLVILFLGTIALVGLIACAWLAALERAIPDVLVAVPSASAGSLGTLLTTRRAAGGKRRRATV